MEAGILPPELKSIEQLFTPDAVFSVPKYQRNFAWGTDEVEELWEDVLTALTRKTDYFLGTVVLQRTGPTSHEIIDGQQRLACLSMFFSAIRALFLATGDPRSEQIFFSFLGAKGFTREAQAQPKLVLNRINNETFVHYVVGSQGFEAVEMALRAKTLHESNRMLLQAYRFFVQRVSQTATSKGADYETYIVGLIDCLRSALKFITIPVADAEDAHLFFESLNARGKELAISDLVKNRLYFEAGSQLPRAQNLWEQMESHVGARPVPEFIRHYWIAKKADEGSLNVREKHLYRAIAGYVKNREAITLDLLSDLARSAKDYGAIADYNAWPDDPAYADDFGQTLDDLRLFRVTQCNPLLLNAIQRFARPKDIARVFRIVTNFSFRYFIIGNQSPGNLERESARIALRIREGVITKPGEVGEAFLAINPDRVFRADFSVASISPGRARMARYLLARISNHVLVSSGGTGPERVTNPYAKAITLEHVVPQSLGKEWKKSFSKAADPSEYVHRIGNLTLLLKKPNSDAADKSFAEKRKLALDQSGLPINTMFSKVRKWGDAEIEKRQADLANVALEVWKLN